MKAYEAAKLLKMTNKEFLATYEIKSHLSKLSAELEAELFGEEKKIEEAPEQGAEVADSAEVLTPDELVKGNEVKSSDVETCPYTPEQVAKSIRLLGNKSKAWKWRNG